MATIGAKMLIASGKRRLITALSFFLCIYGFGAQAQEKVPPVKLIDIYSFMETYYRDPRPDAIDQAISALETIGSPRNEGEEASLVGFFAEVMADNPIRVQHWRARIQERTSGKLYDTLQLALSASKNLSVLTDVPNDMLTPTANDLCWGAFFASGKRIYIQKLLDRLEHLKERKNLLLYTTAASALWSISSNMQQHLEVRARVYAEIGAYPKSIQNAVSLAESRGPVAVQADMLKVIKKQHKKGIW